jgi:hypothetical protein
MVCLSIALTEAAMCSNATISKDVTNGGATIPCNSFFGFSFVEAFKTAPGKLDLNLVDNVTLIGSYGAMDGDSNNLSLVRRIAFSVVGEYNFTEALAVYYLQGQQRAWMRVWRSDEQPLTAAEIFSFSTTSTSYALEQSDGQFTASHAAHHSYAGPFFVNPFGGSGQFLAYQDGQYNLIGEPNEQGGHWRVLLRTADISPSQLLTKCAPFDEIVTKFGCCFL